MSLENFQIPVLLLPELYKDSLVQLDITQASADKIEENELIFLGNNRKNILILVNESESVHLEDVNMELLSNILNACKLNMNDVCLINVNKKNKIIVKNLISQFKAECLLIFGNLPISTQLPDTLNLYENKVHENCRMLQVDDLNKIGSNPELKKILWNALKALFNL